jgi:hypothetical protein
MADASFRATEAWLIALPLRCWHEDAGAKFHHQFWAAASGCARSVLRSGPPWARTMAGMATIAAAVRASSARRLILKRWDDVMDLSIATPPRLARVSAAQSSCLCQPRTTGDYA